MNWLIILVDDLEDQHYLTVVHTHEQGAGKLGESLAETLGMDLVSVQRIDEA